MRLPGSNAHLTYCLNVHPGESWADNFAAIRDKATAVRRLVCPGEPFGLGLRLAAAAARELRAPAPLDALRQFLADRRMYVFTVNAFPYGTFHGTPVKEDVYRPDWTTPQRAAYTLDVAEILANLLPDGVAGSISTVPVGYREFLPHEADIANACDAIARLALELAELENRTGRLVRLALEPEPDCLAGNTGQFIAFYQGPLLRQAAKLEGGQRAVRRHVGICFDTAHAAVAFEDLPASLAALGAAGIPVAKIQASSALASHGGPAARSALEPFCEPVYLHQTTVRTTDGKLAHYPDLPQALAQRPADPAEEWRVHYHVPLFWQGDGPLQSTGGQTAQAVARALGGQVCPHFEIETYTFNVLPPELAPTTLEEGLAEEFRWLLQRLP
jgi:hypothetical protein